MMKTCLLLVENYGLKIFNIKARTCLCKLCSYVFWMFLYSIVFSFAMSFIQEDAEMVFDIAEIPVNFGFSPELEASVGV